MSALLATMAWCIRNCFRGRMGMHLCIARSPSATRICAHRADSLPLQGLLEGLNVLQHLEREVQGALQRCVAADSLLDAQVNRQADHLHAGQGQQYRCPEEHKQVGAVSDLL